MISIRIIILVFVLFIQLNTITCSLLSTDPHLDEEAARKWFDSEYSIQVQKLMNAEVNAEWDSATDLDSEEKKTEKIKAAKANAEYRKKSAAIAKNYKYKEFGDKQLSRLFSKISNIGHGALEEEDFVKITDTISNMTTIYSIATVCDKNKACDLSLDPHLSDIMAESTDYDQLKTVWENWRTMSGAKIKDYYQIYVELSNKAAKANGFSDKGEMWRSEYESQIFTKDVEDLFNRLSTELYQPLQAYVREKLEKKYGWIVDDQGTIPAHVLGNMWAQSWGNVFNIVKPYDVEFEINATPEIEKKTVKDLFLISEEFFTSMGLENMTQTFWNKTMYEKPSNKSVVCHASAWDFYDQEDFRIKMCTKRDMEDFITIHHEMGHIQYFIQYKDQPIPFREGANPGFHEAVGDVLALSVAAPKHLKEINLISNYTSSKEANINFLMMMALEKIAFLPFGFLIDAWRWNVFNGSYSYEEWNKKWWEMRCKYQGIVPPGKRSLNDFDAGAKFHIPNDTPYIRYFVSFIIQFQFHKALCEKAGQLRDNKYIHDCDFYKNKEAGKLLGNMLKKGSSQPWPEAMKEITGQEKMDIQPLLDYFKPLIDFLKEENEKLNNEVGWKCDAIDKLVPTIPIPTTTVSSKDKLGASVPIISLTLIIFLIII